MEWLFLGLTVVALGFLVWQNIRLQLGCAQDAKALAQNSRSLEIIQEENIRLHQKIHLLEERRESAISRAAEAKELRKFEDMSVPENQLRAVSSNDVKFKIQPIANSQEVDVLYALENAVRAFKKVRLRVFAQVSLGAILRCKDDNARRSINSERSDFVVVNNKGAPVLVVEYQGDGHFQGDENNIRDTKKRDEVKRIAFQKAGLNLLELNPSLFVSSVDKVRDYQDKINIRLEALNL